MAEYVVVRQDFSVKLDSERWLVLSEFGSSQWHFQIWGPEPLASDFDDLTANEAKQHATYVATNHLKVVKPEMKVPRTLPWRTVVTAIKPAAPQR